MNSGPIGGSREHCEGSATPKKLNRDPLSAWKSGIGAGALASVPQPGSYSAKIRRSFDYLIDPHQH